MACVLSMFHTNKPACCIQAANNNKEMKGMDEVLMDFSFLK
jgi:hypothetical protein